MRHAGAPAVAGVPVVPQQSRIVAAGDVSGLATVIGYTVNHQQWLPDFAPPYVIANVALADDPTIHLTTNIVDVEPDDVRIGMEVRVRFEHVDDVWIPLFEPTGDTDPVDRVAEPMRPVTRGSAHRRPVRAQVGHLRASAVRDSAGA